MTKINDYKIPLWVSVFQFLLILIMLQQVWMFYFNHDAVAASGISTVGVANHNLLYEFAARTATMAIVSLIVLVSQNPRYFLVVLLMNILREGQETIIDPLYPLANAKASPTADFALHVIIVAIEIFAFYTVFKIVQRMNNSTT